jgi:uncharacterized coiled-coil DUF342 family protein
MTSTLRRRVATVVAAAALTATVAAVPAQAHTKPLRATCTISAAGRAAARDALHADQAKLAGHHATPVEKRALRAAVVALVQAARDAKMSPAARADAKARIAALVAQLEAATTAEERTALRAQITALRLELKTARLTPAERRALAAQVATMRAALRDKPSAADRAAIKADMKVQVALLSCRTVA